MGHSDFVGVVGGGVDDFAYYQSPPKRNYDIICRIEWFLSHLLSISLWPHLRSRDTIIDPLMGLNDNVGVNPPLLSHAGSANVVDHSKRARRCAI